MSESDAAHVVIARVIKPHGIRGEVACEVMSDVSGRFDAGRHVVLGTTPTTITSSRSHQGRMLVCFDGVADRTQAEALRGLEVLAEPVAVDDLDVYLVRELVGMAVVDADGRALGTVRALVELPTAAAYDLLDVERPEGGRWLLPAVDAYVEVEAGPDGVERLAVVDPPAGLLDDLEA